MYIVAWVANRKIPTAIAAMFGQFIDSQLDLGTRDSRFVDEELRTDAYAFPLSENTTETATHATGDPFLVTEDTVIWDLVYIFLDFVESRTVAFSALPGAATV
jgi:hypothetical protein